MRKGWMLALLVVGIAVGVAAAEVYPVRWEDDSEEPPSRALSVASGGVALGEGAIALFPDLKTIGTIQQGVTAGIKVVDPSSCASANRGEIRLFNLSGTGGRIDALCFCARQKLDGEAVATFNWSCLKVPVFPPT